MGQLKPCPTPKEGAVKISPCCWDNTIELRKLDFENPIVEIGFGNGDFTLWLASKFKNQPVLAVDKWHPGIRALIHKCQQRKLDNLYVFNLDANLFVEYLLKPNQVERFYFNYPDPFFKKRDIKRRLLKTSFLSWVAFKLKPRGKVYIRTDIPDYYEYVLEQLEPIRELFEIHKTFDEDLPSTKYELKALKEGRKPLKLLLIKKKDPQDLEDKEVLPLRAIKLPKVDLTKLPLREDIKDPQRGYFFKIENTYKGQNIDLIEIYVGEEGFYQHVFIGVFRTSDGYVIKPKSFAVGVRSLSWAVEKIAELISP